MGLEQPARFGVDDQRNPERRRDAFGRDVVVRWPDAAGREDIVEFVPDLVDGCDDCRGIEEFRRGFPIVSTGNPRERRAALCVVPLLR